MQADFSRWTFDGKAGFRSVLLQQGRVVLDADWNEQTQIAAYHDEVRTGDIVGPSGAPAGDAAFGLVDGTGAAAASTPWGNLRLTPGRFYVDGVLTTVDDPGAPLAEPALPPRRTRAAGAAGARRRRPLRRRARGLQPPRDRRRDAAAARVRARRPRHHDARADRVAGAARGGRRRPGVRRRAPVARLHPADDDRLARRRPARVGPVPDHVGGGLPPAREPALPGPDPRRLRNPADVPVVARERQRGRRPGRDRLDHGHRDGPRAHARPPRPRRGAVDRRGRPGRGHEHRPPAPRPPRLPRHRRPARGAAPAGRVAERRADDGRRPRARAARPALGGRPGERRATREPTSRTGSRSGSATATSASATTG